MESDFAKLEFEALDAFQKEIHFALPSEDYVSDFYREYRRSTWYSLSTVLLKKSIDNNEIVYTASSPKYHVLMFPYMRQTLPALRVKEDFKDRVQIAWCHNVAINRIISGSIQIDTKVLQSFDTKWLDIHPQYFMKPGFRDHYNKCVGNVKDLEEWNTFLPEYTTNIIHPFYHSSDPVNGIPLFYFSSTTHVSYNYSLKSKVEELLRMRFKQIPKDGSEPYWQEINVKLYCIDGLGESTVLPTPELWARYAKLSPPELEFLKTCVFEETYKDEDEEGKEVEKIRPKNRIIYTEDIIARDSSNPSYYGDTVELTLDSTTPSKTFFFMGENLKSREKNNLSNYSTDCENLYNGYNPCSKMELCYGGTSYYNMDIDHFEMIEPWQFPSAPSEPGYNAKTICFNPSSLDPEVGIIMGAINGKIKVKLGNTDPKLKPVKTTESEKQAKTIIEELEHTNSSQKVGDPFKLIVRLLTMKKIIIRRTAETSYEFIF